MNFEPDCQTPGSVGWARYGTALPDEVASGLFFLGVPQLQAGYTF
jgi:hypothetical protein